jgi:hypothetical protein
MRSAFDAFSNFFWICTKPPLSVIGDDSGSVAKLRLLREVAPIIDEVVSHHAAWPIQFADDSGRMV